MTEIITTQGRMTFQNFTNVSFRVRQMAYQKEIDEASVFFSKWDFNQLRKELFHKMGVDIKSKPININGITPQLDNSLDKGVVRVIFAD